MRLARDLTGAQLVRALGKVGYMPTRQTGSALVARLLDSLESAFDDSPEAVASAWDEEIERRIADCDVGRTQGIPVEQVQVEIQLLLRQHARA